MRGARSLFVFLSWIVATAAFARPVLVAVDLPDRESIKRWHSLDHPSFAYLENSAIAEIDESELLVLAQEGFTPRVIDTSAWNQTYAMCFREQTRKPDLPGTVLWQKGNLSLCEVTDATLNTLRRRGFEFQLMEKTPLPDRFWEGLMVKHIPLRSLEWDPWVQSLVDEVSEDSLTTYIQRLIAFKTRFATHESCFAAAEWLDQRLSGWGYPTEIQEFSIWYPGNVIATKSGDATPSEMILIGGHYDSRPSTGYAPGADDNATGTAAALEAARIFAAHSFDHTMQFICWSAEEEGRIGSRHYVEEALNESLEIGGYVNLDMIGYMDDDLLDCETQSMGTFSYPLVILFKEAAATYIPDLAVSIEEEPGSSDWRSFIDGGYAAVGGMEHDGTHFNPYYHTTEDEFWTLTPELYTAITKAAVATMAVLGVSPPMLREVAVHDMGDGQGLEVRWEAPEASDIVGYSIQWGMASETYTDSGYVVGAGNTSFTLTDLATDSTYYFVVRAHDQDGYQSWTAMEASGAPRIVPFAPTGVTATPVADGIRIDWNRNIELDVAGYRVCRRINEATEYDSLNMTLVTDTTFTDIPLSGADKYYYVVRAIDASGNFSPLSDEVYGRPLTLDQGILIVDETRNTSNHPDELQDAFYRSILEGYWYSEIEYGAGEALVFADLAPYSTVLWHADEYAQALAWQRTEDIADYLEAGGRLWFVGWKPTACLTDEVDYPLGFGPGDFMYDCMKVSYSDLSSPADSFHAAIGLLDYPMLEVDPEKVPIPTWGPTLRYVEALTPVPPAEAIYSIDMTDDGSSFEGEVCGIRYSGSDFQVVYFGFPLYFMDQDQARAVAQKVMSDFGELPVDEDAPGGVRVTQLRLLQNTPNPFSARTNIRYYIPANGQVNLSIYNIAGRLVTTLVSDQMRAGNHSVKWNGTDSENRYVGNGVYLCQLQVRDRTLSRKLVLVR